MTTTTSVLEQQTLVETEGVLPTDIVDQAQARIGALVRRIAPGVPARLRLHRIAHPGFARPVVAQLRVVLHGRSFGVQVAGATVDDAIEALAIRAGRRSVVARQHAAWPDDASRESWWSNRPEHLVLPPWERWLVREKNVRLAVMPIAEAAEAAEWLDLDEHLFVEATTGRPAVIRRFGVPDHVCEIDAPDDQLIVPVRGIAISRTVVPALTTTQAAEMLGRSGRRSVFFVDPATAAGRLLYIRYDGDYSLVSA